MPEPNWDAMSSDEKRWMCLGELGFIVSICYGPSGSGEPRWTVQVLMPDGEEFDRPFVAHSLTHALEIAMAEITARGWVPRSIMPTVVNDRPGPDTHCPTVLYAGSVAPVTHGTVRTFIGIAYMLTLEWEAVHCTKCQRVLRWASDSESVINTALRAADQVPPEIPA
jgi:hypothetical protein